MKRVTASQARRHWFRLLDEVAAGEVVVIERQGRRLLLRREGSRGRQRLPPDYSKLISVNGPDRADRWTWGWSPRKGLVHRSRRGG